MTFGAVWLDDDVADLARAVAVASEQLAIEDEAGTDAAPDLDRDEVGGTVIAFEQERGQGRGPAVVGDDRREVIAVGQDAAERQVGPLEVDGPADRPVGRDDARRPDSDAQDRLVGRGEEPFDELMDDGDGGVAIRALEVP